MIDGEAFICDESGLAVFELIRGHGSKTSAVLCAFDVLAIAAMCGGFIADAKASVKPKGYFAPTQRSCAMDYLRLVTDATFASPASIWS
jgi:hypothetical protein